MGRGGSVHVKLVEARVRRSRKATGKGPLDAATGWLVDNGFAGVANHLLSDRGNLGSGSKAALAYNPKLAGDLLLSGANVAAFAVPLAIAGLAHAVHWPLVDGRDEYARLPEARSVQICIVKPLRTGKAANQLTPSLLQQALTILRRVAFVAYCRVHVAGAHAVPLDYTKAELSRDDNLDKLGPKAASAMELKGPAIARRRNDYYMTSDAIDGLGLAGATNALLKVIMTGTPRYRPMRVVSLVPPSYGGEEDIIFRMLSVPIDLQGEPRRTWGPAGARNAARALSEFRLLHFNGTVLTCGAGSGTAAVGAAKRVMFTFLGIRDPRVLAAVNQVDWSLEQFNALAILQAVQFASRPVLAMRVGSNVGSAGQATPIAADQKSVTKHPNLHSAAVAWGKRFTTGVSGQRGAKRAEEISAAGIHENVSVGGIRKMRVENASVSEDAKQGFGGKDVVGSAIVSQLSGSTGQKPAALEDVLKEVAKPSCAGARIALSTCRGEKRSAEMRVFSSRDQVYSLNVDERSKVLNTLLASIPKHDATVSCVAVCPASGQLDSLLDAALGATEGGSLDREHSGLGVLEVDWFLSQVNQGHAVSRLGLGAANRAQLMTDFEAAIPAMNEWLTELVQDFEVVPLADPAKDTIEGLVTIGILE